MNKTRLMRQLIYIAAFAMLVSCRSIGIAQVSAGAEGLRYYQIRYGQNMGKPLPEGKVEFFILDGDTDKEYNIPRYVYLMLTQSLDNMKVSRDMSHFNYRYVTTLDRTEIERLFNRYGEDAFGRKKHLIRLSILQKADIEKIYRQMYSVDPNMPEITEMSYGVKMNSRMEPVLDAQEDCVPDNSDDAYRKGRTIVLPECYLRQKHQAFFYNFNNPAVREYCIRVALKTHLLSGANIFLDNYGVIGSMKKSFDKGLFCDGDKSANVRQYANQLSAVCKEIKDRADEKVEIIANCFLPRIAAEDRVFLKTLTAEQNITGFDGFMAESIYGRYGYSENLVEWFVSWAEYLDRHGVKLLLASARHYLSEQKDSKYALNFQLFSLLIARGNVYTWYSNTTNQPMVDYDARHISIGSSLDSEPVREDKKWVRRYQQGTVILDTEKNGWDGIRLETEE